MLSVINTRKDLSLLASWNNGSILNDRDAQKASRKITYISPNLYLTVCDYNIFIFLQLQGCKSLEIPLIVTEQYPKGLGNTVPELDISHAVKVFPKTKFSMVLPEVETEMKNLCGGDVQHVVLFGIEVMIFVLNN